MFKKLHFLAFLFISFPALAQNVTCATRPVGDSTNACASTAFVGTAQSFITGDCTITAGVITCLKTNGNLFGSAALINTGLSGATVPVLNAKGNIFGPGTTPAAVTAAGYGNSFRNSTVTSASMGSGVVGGPVYNVLESVAFVPSGSTITSVNALAGYVKSEAAGGSQGNGVSAYLPGIVGANNAKAWNINGLLVDDISSVTPSGFTGNSLIPAEFDLWNMNTGSTWGGVNMILGGPGAAYPAGAFVGGFAVSKLSGTTNSFFRAFTVGDASALGALNIGAKATSGANIAGIPSYFSYFDGAGTKRSVSLQASNAAFNICSTAFDDCIYAQSGTGTIEIGATGASANINISLRPKGTALLVVTSGITTAEATFLHRTSVSLTDGAGVAAGTLTNAPSAGDPTKWIQINDNGTTRRIPSW